MCVLYVDVLCAFVCALCICVCMVFMSYGYMGIWVYEFVSTSVYISARIVK